MSNAGGFLGLGLAAAIALWGASRAAASEPLPTSAEHVATPGRSVAADETADAIVLNPANLSGLPAPELRWTWVKCPDTVVKVGCGHSWEAGTPLFWGLSTALRVDLVQPPWGGGAGEGLGFPYRGDDFVWVTWGLSSKLGENASVGVSLDRSYSKNEALDGLFGVTAALSFRPAPSFGLALVARDFNRPRSELLAPMLPQSSDSLPVLDARFVAALAFRPTGRRDLEVGLEGEYWEGAGLIVPRATLGVDVPSVGRAYASVEASHLNDSSRLGVVGTAGLEVHLRALGFRGVGVGGGALFGDGLGGNGQAGGYLTASIAGYTEPGVPPPARAVSIRIETTPGTRGHVALLRRLWRLATEPDIAAVTLIVRAEPAGSFAHAEELADAIRVIKTHGKKVLCSFEDAGPRALYVCASADRIVVSPAGGLRYAGLRSQYMYLRGLLDKIGVRGAFVRIGPHKTAPEEFTNQHAGPVANEDHIDLLSQQQAVFERNLSLYRHMSEARIREVTLKGPYIATEARDAGFVDSLAYDDELERATRDLVGRGVHLEKVEDVPAAASFFGPRGKIAILYLDGDIVDGRSQKIPLLNMRLVGSYSMTDSIRELRDDRSVSAVVLRVESGGGSSLASELMWRELVLLGKKKPLIVSMGSVAASGGYLVSSASRNVFALPLTITGSIGVFYGKADVSGLLEKLGVSIDTYKTAPRADAESLFRGFTPDEERELQHKVEQFYDSFLDRVSEGRGMSKSAIDAVGRGRVWTGQQALIRGLVDHLGGMREALQAAREAAHLADDAPIVEYPRESQTLVQMALDAVIGGSTALEPAASSLPPAVQTLGRALSPLVIFRGDEPMARLEWVDADDWLAP